MTKSISEGLLRKWNKTRKAIWMA